METMMRIVRLDGVRALAVTGLASMGKAVPDEFSHPLPFVTALCSGPRIGGSDGGG